MSTSETNKLVSAQWLTRKLDSSTWSQFEQELFTVVVTYLSNNFEYGALGFLLSDEDWAALPGITVNGVVAVKPTVPPIPVQPAPSDGSAQDDRRYDRERKDTTRLEGIRAEVTSICRCMKQLLLNPDLGGAAHSVAVGSGDQFTKINEGPSAPFARLKEHLGTPDQDTFNIWSAVYRTPAEHLPVSEWMRQDDHANTLLTPHGHQLSDIQRMTAFQRCYKLSPKVMKCWDDYCTSTPALKDRTLVDAFAYIRGQEPNIQQVMKPSDIGFSAPPSAVTGGVNDSPLAVVATEQTYTQAQMDQAVADALARVNPGKSTRYCWLHGYQLSHSGRECKGIVAGKSLRAPNRDSRPPCGDATMVFSHPNCGHSPRCISVEDARRATGPQVRNKADGNAIKSGDRNFDGSR